jgi:uncharacterized membrane protein/ketosteroid isomerase-like protein
MNTFTRTVSAIVGIALAATLAGCREQESTVISNDPRTREEVSAALDRLNQLLSARNTSIVDEFASTPDVILLGSEAGEVAIGRDQLAAFFDRLFALPVQLSWEWKERRISSEGDVAWVFADGSVVLTSPSGEMRAPYRMTGVLQRTAGQWRWRQFHGSEPAGQQATAAASPPPPAGAKDPWQNARERGVDFRAVGQEPGWYLEMNNEKSMRLVWDYQDHDLNIVIDSRPCQDGMSGAPYPNTVVATIDGRELRGCGRFLN